MSLRKEIEVYKNTTYLIELDGKIIGFYNDEFLENGDYEIGNICIIPEYQGKGVNALIFKEFVLSANKLGFEVAESNPELELNNRVQSMWDGLEVEQHKKRRAYIKEL